MKTQSKTMSFPVARYETRGGCTYTIVAHDEPAWRDPERTAAILEAAIEAFGENTLLVSQLPEAAIDHHYTGDPRVKQRFSWYKVHPRDLDFDSKLVIVEKRSKGILGQLGQALGLQKAAA